jgi:hypothetical protein
MANILRFTDPKNDATVRLDISTQILGLEEPDFGFPEGDRRRLVLPMLLSGTSKDNLIQRWRDLVAQVEDASALEVRLDGATSSVWFDPLLVDLNAAARSVAPAEDRGVARPLYDWARGRSQMMRADLELVCRPYARGAEVSQTVATIANAPDASNFFEVASPAGDVPAPARIQVDLDVAPNRLAARFYRRTAGTLANYVSIYEAESASLFNGTASQGEGSASGGNSTRTTPANQTLNKTHEWSAAANTADRTGLVHVWAKIKDGGATPGQIEARAELEFPGAAKPHVGDTVVVTADADHDGNTAYELWYLGSFRIPDDPAPASWTWRLALRRTVGVATIDVDYLLVTPAEESVGGIDWRAGSDITANTVKSFSLDSEKAKAWYGTLSEFRAHATAFGRGLFLKPGVTNRIIVAASSDAHATLDQPPSITVDPITQIVIKHRPRYALVRGT